MVLPHLDREYPRLVASLEPAKASSAFAHAILNPLGSATGMAPAPRTTTALSFLDPLTAPGPPLAADRKNSCCTLANFTRFSPAGPIERTRTEGSRSSFFIRVSVSKVPFPQRWLTLHHRASGNGSR